MERSLANSMLRTLLTLSGLLFSGLLQAAQLQVFVPVVPLQTFVEKIGGHHVLVDAVIRPGHDPHTYTPAPSQIRALSSAALYISAGSEFDRSWMKRIRGVNPEMVIADALQGIDLHGLEHHDHHHHEGEEALDPHVWTSPLLAKQMAKNIQQALSEIDPDHQADYHNNYLTFAAELDQLHWEIEQWIGEATQRTFMVFHPVWGYFAETYGLTQIAIEEEGKSPRAQRLTQLIEKARAHQVKVIFVQPQMSQRAAHQVAIAIHGRVVAVDPLAADYINNLRSVARQFARAQ